MLAPESVLAWIIIGAVAGWLAGVLIKGYGFGLIGNIVIGILGAVLCLRDRHGGMRRQQVDQHAGVVRIEVLDQNERHARIGRHMS
jgi:Predicted membrane protein